MIDSGGAGDRAGVDEDVERDFFEYADFGFGLNLGMGESDSRDDIDDRLGKFKLVAVGFDRLGGGETKEAPNKVLFGCRCLGGWV